MPTLAEIILQRAKSALLSAGIVLKGGGGDDALIGGPGDDKLFGRQGNDTLLGLGGNDRLSGDPGDDVLEGGEGDDILRGGSGNDTYVVNYGDGNDTVVDQSGWDTLQLAGGSQSPGSVLHDVRRSGDDLIVRLGDGTEVRVVGHYAGNEIESIVFPTFAGIPIFSESTSFAVAGSFVGNTGEGDHDEIFVGSDGDDVIDGGDGTDIIFGHGGNDTLFGGAGDDYIEGGPGADYIDGGSQDTLSFGGDFAVYKNSDAAVSIDLGAGIAMGGDAESDVLVNIEGLIGSDFNDVLIGQNFVNNRFRGRSGDDYIDGRSGFNMVDYDDSPDGVQVDLAANFAYDGWGGTDTILNIQRVNGSTFDDVLLGADAPFELFRGRAGDDYIDGRAGIDEVEYITARTGVYVNLEDGIAHDGEGGTDTLRNIENVRGSFFDDVLIGDANPNLLNGLDGDDVLIGGPGADVLNGGLGSDTASYAGAAFAVMASLANPAINTGDAAGDSYFGIENLIGTSFADRLFGDASANRISGGGGNDQLFGGPGHDLLDGGDGDDFLDGGDGDDVLLGGRDADVFFGGSGNDFIDGGVGVSGNLSQGFTHRSINAGDTVSYATSPSGVTVDLAAGTASDGFGGTDTLVNIGAAVGSHFDDYLSAAGAAGDPRKDGFIFTGLNGADTIVGRPGILSQVSYAPDPSGVSVDLAAGYAIDGWGNTDTLIDITHVIGSDHGDILLGSGANERFRGRAGNDYIDGGGGIDEVDYQGGNIGAAGVTVTLGEAGEAGSAFGGNVGVDTLYNVENIRGSAGNDVLTGNGGDNQLRGLAGNDILDGRDGNDTVDYFFSPFAVTVDLALGFALDGHGGLDTLISIENINGSLEGDTLLGDDGDNGINGDEGDDTIDGRGGNDTLTGGPGDDLFVFGLGTGHDIVVDFTPGAGSPDRLDLRAFGFADFDAVLAAADDSDGAGPTVIDLGDGDSVTLFAVQLWQLHPDDFLFG